MWVTALNTMNENELIPWLMDRGGSAIRYRTATELMDDCPASLTRELADSLFSHSKAKKLLPLLDAFNQEKSPEIE